MRMLAFASRVRKEVLRDPLTLLLSLGLPIALLVLMTIIQNNVPVPIFVMERLAPAIAVFSLTFISLFGGMLISRDRSTSLLMRLFASPLRPWEYILGYSLPLLPIGLAQSAICFLAAICLGYRFSPNLLIALLVLLPVAALFVAFGVLLGTLLPDKAVGGISSLLVNVAGLLGGMWFDLNLMGKGLRGFAYALPFAHAVDMTRAAAAGRFAEIPLHLWWVLGYTVVIFAIAIPIFRRQMKYGKY